MIDVHAHFLPDFYLAALARAGIATVDGYPLPSWSVENALATMDMAGIGASVLSISSPGVRFLQSSEAASACHKINDFARDLVGVHGARFGAFAMLPLPDVEAAITEVRRTLDDLSLDGVGLFTNYGGRYLGDPVFEPLLAELNSRSAVIFVHPTQPMGFDAVGMGFPAPLLEYPFDTTRTIVSLLRAGALRRHRRLKIIFSHGGGALPFLAPRITRIMPLTGAAPEGEDTRALDETLRGLYFDLTSTGHAGALAALDAFVPRSQLLWGFDLPFMRPVTIQPARAAVEAFGKAQGFDLGGICAANAQRLFPALAQRMDKAAS